MMTYGREILNHHLLTIEALQNQKDLRLRERVSRTIQRIAKFRLTNGEPAYPGLDNLVISTDMAKALLQGYVIVNSGNFSVVPDRNSDGSRNFDLICRVCPNYTGRANCRLDEFTEKGICIKNA